MPDFSEVSQTLISGDHNKLKEIVTRLLAEGANPQEVLNDGLLPGMAEVGRRFKASEMFVPEVLMTARAMNAAVAILKPALIAGKAVSAGKVVIGTVKGDLHDIGKNIVTMMLEGAGYQVIDLGMDVAPEKFLKVFEAEKPHVIGMSAMLTTTMEMMRKTIEVFTEKGLRSEVRFVIGGAPVTAKYAEAIGADGYAEDAIEAVSLVKNLVH